MGIIIIMTVQTWNINKRSPVQMQRWGPHADSCRDECGCALCLAMQRWECGHSLCPSRDGSVVVSYAQAEMGVWSFPMPKQRWECGRSLCPSRDGSVVVPYAHAGMGLGLCRDGGVVVPYSHAEMYTCKGGGVAVPLD